MRGSSASSLLRGVQVGGRESTHDRHTHTLKTHTHLKTHTLSHTHTHGTDNEGEGGSGSGGEWGSYRLRLGNLAQYVRIDR